MVVMMMMMTNDGDNSDGGSDGDDDDGGDCGDTAMCRVEPMGLCDKKIFLRTLYFSMYIQWMLSKESST